MKIPFRPVFTVLVLVILGHHFPAFAQGGLTPPGAPTPTMKSLRQVEPRTAITDLPFTISQGGSYYLTRSFDQSFSAQAISITTNNVTLDFCGFTIHQTASNLIHGIFISSASGTLSPTNIILRNGIITGFTNGSGVRSFGLRNSVFENLTVTKCGQGLEFQTGSTPGVVGNLVRDCRTCDNSGSGIIFNIAGATNTANVIEHCESLNNNTTGFVVGGSGNLIITCRASGNANNYNIAIGNRMGLLVLPATNSVAINGSSGGTGTGTTDPFANLSY